MEGYGQVGNLGYYSEGLVSFRYDIPVENSIFEHADWEFAQIRENEITGNGKCGYMDLEGKVITFQQYSNGYPFGKGLAGVVSADGTSVDTLTNPEI